MTPVHHLVWELSERVAEAITEALKAYPGLRAKFVVSCVDSDSIRAENVEVSFRAPQRRAKT